MPVYDTITIRGRKIEVSLNKDALFTAEHLGEKYESASFAGLKKTLSASLAKKALNIPFYEISGDRDDNLNVREGKVVSIHSATNRPIVIFKDKEKAEVADRWHTDRLDIKVDLKKLKKLHDAYLRAAKELDEYKDAHRLVLKDLEAV